MDAETGEVREDAINQSGWALVYEYYDEYNRAMTLFFEDASTGMRMMELHFGDGSLERHTFTAEGELTVERYTADANEILDSYYDYEAEE